MKTRFALTLALLITLALTTAASSQEALNYVSSIYIYVDGFICETCVRTLENTLMQADGVKSVEGDLGEGTLHVTPKMDGSYIDLLDFEQRINGTRQYTVLEMEVAAVGRVVKFPAEYYIGGVYAYTGDRYKLEAGKTEFILAKNEKLDDLLNSGYETVSVHGTVTSFRNRAPIMKVETFEKVLGETSPQAVTGMVPEQIFPVDIHVDGFICATCERILKSALTVEEGVSKIDADMETGVVTVTPTMYGRDLDLSALWNQVNATREYTAKKMDITAIGHVVKTNVRYFSAREYSHSHDRYMLQIGDDNARFILSENEMLDQLINAGYKKVKVQGTVTAFSAKVPILLIGQFNEVGKEVKQVTYKDPLDAISASLVDEKRFMNESKEPKQIESIRIYVDGFICATCGESIKRDVLDEEGVEIVSTDQNLGLIEVIPKDMETFEIHDLWQRINAMREYEVLKMDVIASGKLISRDIVYGQGTFDQETVKRYMLVAGKSIRFILSENENLEKMIKSGDKMYTVIGTITAFKGNDPILDISSYKKLQAIPEWLKWMPETSE